jgi:8-oxo-dGTP pyrophosphatase MutT (NUDIX family)
MNETSEPDQLKQGLARKLAARSRLALEGPELTCAAVLIPLLFKEGAWHVLVTQRTQTLEHHPGQISFPGGACEVGDCDLSATALRETWEEVGIPASAVEVIGPLDDLITITNFVVTPFVGILRPPFRYAPNGREVEAIIEVPLSFLCDDGNLRQEQREYAGHVYDLLFWDYGSYTIWGATARILKGLLDLVCGLESRTGSGQEGTLRPASHSEG